MKSGGQGTSGRVGLRGDWKGEDEGGPDQNIIHTYKILKQ